MNGSNIHIRINNYFLVAKHTAAFFSVIFKHSSLFFLHRALTPPWSSNVLVFYE